MRATRSSRLGVLASVISLVATLVASPPAAAAPNGLHWHECGAAMAHNASAFECTRLDVPMDRGNPAGPTFSLALARHRSTGTAGQRLGSLVFNPGGPGASGLDALPAAWNALPRKVQDRYDLVSWDPRGTGATIPAPKPCAEADLSGIVPESGPVDWEAVGTRFTAVVAAGHAACEEENADIVDHLSSNEAAADLEALRLALGDSELNYWGVSYGTRIGQAYALRYPDRVGVMLLDSPMFPGPWTVDTGVQMAIAGTQSYSVFARHFPASARSLRRVIATVQTTPVTLPNGVVLDRWLVPDLIAFLSASEELYPAVQGLVDQLHVAVLGTGPSRRAAQIWLVDFLSNLAWALDTGDTDWVSSAIWCLDQSARPVPAELVPSAEALERGWSAAEAMALMTQAAVCSGWGFAPDPLPTAEPPSEARAPVLVVGSRWDGRTFGGWIEDMATTLTPARTITYLGGQHGVYGSVDSQCVDGAVTRYLLTGRLPTRDRTCPSTVS